MVGVPLPVPGSLLVEEPDVGHPEEAVQEANHHLCTKSTQKVSSFATFSQ